MNERGRERTAAGLGTVGRRWEGGGGRGRGAGGGGLSPYFSPCLKRGGGGGRGAWLLTLTRVSYVF